MGEPLSKFFSFLLDLVVPPRGSELLVRTLTLEELQACAAAGEALPYDDPLVRALVWEIKYHKNPRALLLAGKLLSEILVAEASEALGKPLLIPAPMHKARRRERGHNQCELLCEAALPHLQGFCEYAPDALIRQRNAPPQQGLVRHERLHNVEGSMQVVRPERVLGRSCIVLDDVTTTGATLAEATRALLAAGASSVTCIALARA